MSNMKLSYWMYVMAEQDPDQRLWKVLETIDRRLGGIEKKLETVVRLEERVNNHEHVISRYGNRLDETDGRLRKIELWQAENNQQNIANLKERIETLQDTGNVKKGQRDVTKEVLKWVAGILAAILIYQSTRGF